MEGRLSSTSATLRLPAVSACPSVPLELFSKVAVETKRLQVTFGVHRPAIFQRLSYGQQKAVQPCHTSRRPSHESRSSTLGAGQHANGGSWAAYPSCRQLTLSTPGSAQWPVLGLRASAPQANTRLWAASSRLVLFVAHLHKAGVALGRRTSPSTEITTFLATPGTVLVNGQRPI